MANEENLKPFTSEQSREEAVKNGRKGGVASGAAKREKRAMKETLEILLNMSTKGGRSANIDQIREIGALKGKNISVAEAIGVKMIQKALKGDLQSVRTIMQLTGQLEEKQQIDVSASVPVVISGSDELED